MTLSGVCLKAQAVPLVCLPQNSHCASVRYSFVLISSTSNVYQTSTSSICLSRLSFSHVKKMSRKGSRSSESIPP